MIIDTDGFICTMLLFLFIALVLFFFPSLLLTEHFFYSIFSLLNTLKILVVAIEFTIYIYN